MNHTKHININVSKKNVNNFLDTLWDTFEKDIFKPSCYHTYTATDNTEIYIYKIHWYNEPNNLDVIIDFFNHTANGLKSITISSTSIEFLNKINNSINLTLKIYLKNISKELTYIARVPIETEYELSGNYKFEHSILGIEQYKSESTKTTGYIHIPIFENNINELNSIVIQKSYVLVSILTVATQNIFTVNEEEEFSIIKASDYKKIISTGTFHFDNALIDEVKYTVKDDLVIWEDNQDKNQMIIEERDCIRQNILGLPNRMQEIFNLVSENYRLEQSCNRYLEGLTIRKKLFNGYIRGANSSQQYMMSYELIAYVSSIEALLNTYAHKEIIKCPNCGTEVFKEEWKIKKKFISFVQKHTEYYNYEIFKKTFSQLYDDRSLFVHTGHNLIKPYAIRSNRPLILKGKNFLKNNPDYYENIHEYVGYLLRKNIYSNFKSPRSHAQRGNKKACSTGGA